MGKWAVLQDIFEELKRQDEKWGEQNHSSMKWLAILSEEIGELAKEIVENGEIENMRHEAIHAAAVLHAFIEHLDRLMQHKKWKEE